MLRLPKEIFNKDGIKASIDKGSYRQFKTALVRNKIIQHIVGEDGLC